MMALELYPFPKSPLGKEAHYPTGVLVYPSPTISLSEPRPGWTGNLRAHVNLFSRQYPLFPNSEKGFLLIVIISSSSVKWVDWLGKYSCNLIIHVRIFAFRGRKEIE